MKRAWKRMILLAVSAAACGCKPAVKQTQNYWEVIETIDAFRVHYQERRERSTLPDASLGRKLSR